MTKATSGLVCAATKIAAHEEVTAEIIRRRGEEMVLLEDDFESELIALLKWVNKRDYNFKCNIAMILDIAGVDIRRQGAEGVGKLDASIRAAGSFSRLNDLLRRSDSVPLIELVLPTATESPRVARAHAHARKDVLDVVACMTTQQTGLVFDLPYSLHDSSHIHGLGMPPNSNNVIVDTKNRVCSSASRAKLIPQLGNGVNSHALISVPAHSIPMVFVSSGNSGEFVIDSGVLVGEEQRAVYIGDTACRLAKERLDDFLNSGAAEGIDGELLTRAAENVAQLVAR